MHSYKIATALTMTGPERAMVAASKPTVKLFTAAAPKNVTKDVKKTIAATSAKDAEIKRDSDGFARCLGENTNTAKQIAATAIGAASAMKK